MVSALGSGLSGPVLSPGWENYVIFLGKKKKISLTCCLIDYTCR